MSASAPAALPSPGEALSRDGRFNCNGSGASPGSPRDSAGTLFSGTLFGSSGSASVLRLQGATIGGLVVSAADGSPVRDAILSLRPVEGPEYLVATATKSDGRFMIYRVQPNRYRLEAKARGFLVAGQDLQVATGQTLDNLEIRLEPAPGARVRVRLASGQVPTFVHVTSSRSGRSAGEERSSSSGSSWAARWSSTGCLPEAGFSRWKLRTGRDGRARR